jgi:hypothetical protein
MKKLILVICVLLGAGCSPACKSEWVEIEEIKNPEVEYFAGDGWGRDTRTVFKGDNGVVSCFGEVNFLEGDSVFLVKEKTPCCWVEDHTRIKIVRKDGSASLFF